MGDHNIWNILPQLTAPAGSVVTFGEISSVLNFSAGLLAADAAALAGLAAWAFVIPGGAAIGLSLVGAATVAGVLSGTFWAMSATGEWVEIEPAPGGASQPIVQPASTTVSQLTIVKDAAGFGGTLDGNPVRTRVVRVDRNHLLNARAFDVNKYVRYHQDLYNPAGKDDHWATYGIREGRRANEVLDPVYYLGLYQDLQDAFGLANYLSAAQHWVTNGLDEGRQSAMEFDVRWYLKNHPDLLAAFGWDFAKALEHWWNHGLSEGRRASAEFDVAYYLNSNPDLQSAFGDTNYPEAMSHWIEYGKNEGRAPIA